MGQPEVKRTFDATSIQGLDHVFVEVVDSESMGTPEAIPEGFPSSTEAIPEGIPTEIKTIPQGIPVEEAARVLGASQRAIIKRLQKGTLPGFKVPTKFGDKWLVAPEAIPNEARGTPEALPEGSPSSTEAIPEGIPSSNRDTLQGVPVEIVQELLLKVEALTYRNGYLEAQLAEKDTHIKLLTDSQHKTDRWSRFWGWFTGR